MNTSSAEEYLRHAGALRALARTLVADESAADDVAQDTWLAALRRPPSDAGNPRGWLAAAARNAARQIGRADARRRRRELVAALPERLPAVEEVAERAALHRELVDRVLALEEPYRSALLLRYFEDLPPRAIAAQLGEKVTTIHARLMRGRQRLREELDRRYGERTSWRGFFVLALGGPEAFLPPPPPLGWVHSLPAKLGAAAVLASGLWLGARALQVEPAGPDRRSELVAALAPVPADVVDELVSASSDVDRGAPAPAPVPGSDVDRASTPTDGAPILALARRAGPPGLVEVQGGRIAIGTKVKDVEPLVVANEPMADFLVAETPQHLVRVEDFHLMVSEVTNEQFAAFVAATGWRPPYTWGGAAIEEARMVWFAEDKRKRQDVKAAGRRYIADERFDPERWWDESWKDAPWSVPDELADHPVIFVSYTDAAAYARWAGVRLMTEFEFQCAGRGKKGDVYPWGDDWDPRKAAGLEAGRDTTWPVGSFPKGARDGIVDLVGNVWEWTSSPYDPYDGYEALDFRGERTISPLAPFDAKKCVAVGGSVHADALGLRLAVRMPSVRDQRTNALGFRCAASAAPGVDLARHALADELAAVADGLAAERVLLLERWRSERGRAGRRVRDYAVITGYDHVAFVPARDASEPAEGPLLLGALLTTVPIAAPELAPGAYLLVRDAGRIRVLDPERRGIGVPAAGTAGSVERLGARRIDVELGAPLEHVVLERSFP
jgi:RNA polymerase sigma factor (sigma-70 family)